MYQGGWPPLHDARAIGPEAVTAEWDHIWARGRRFAEYVCMHETIGKWRREGLPMNFTWLEYLDAEAERWGKPRVSPDSYVHPPVVRTATGKRTREDEFAEAAATGAEVVDAGRPKRQRRENVRLKDL